MRPVHPSLFWARTQAHWQQQKHNHPFAWALNSGCPACKRIIRLEVRLWNHVTK